MSTVETLVGAVYEGRYAIERVLSIGGMGTLFKATQLAVARTVCVRVVNPEKVPDPAKVERFITEARKLASFSHSNVIDLIDFGQDDQGRLFQVREYLEGERLYQLIEREAPLAAERIEHICAQILDALAEAHAQGIVHRDLNPRNIFVTTIGTRSDFIKLLEFRLAHGRDDTWVEREPEKPHYKPPELIDDANIPVDDRCDLYALGCILYQMLTGHVPFAFSTRADVARAHLHEPPPPPYVAGQAVRGRLVDLIMRCMQKSPDDRPEDAAEALSILRTGTAPLLAAGKVDSSPTQQPAVSASTDPLADTAEDLSDLNTQPKRGMGTGPLLRHQTATIRHSGDGRVQMEADCDLPGAGGSAVSHHEPKRRVLPFILGGVLLGGVVLAGVVLLGEKMDGAVSDHVATSARAQEILEAPGEGLRRSTESDATASGTQDLSARADAATSSAGPDGTAAPSSVDAAAISDSSPPGPPDTAPTPPVGAKPFAVKVKIETVPKGAMVVNGANGKRVATTPATLQFASDQPPLLRLEHAGYLPVELTLSATSRDMRLVLDKAPTSAATPPTPAVSAPGKPNVTAKKKKKKKKKKKRVRGVKDLLGP